jgi:DNA-binding MarR family transcriptional regulator
MSALHAIRSASLDAYHGHIIGSRELDQAGRVEAEITRQGRCTRRMVAESLGMETSTVSARVNKLLKDGRIVETGYLKQCPITGKQVNWLMVTPAQAELFA